MVTTTKPEYTTTTHPSIPYICLSSTLPMSQLSTLAHKIPQLFQFLASTSPRTQPAGPPFWRYLSIPVDMQASQLIEVDVGLPVSADFKLPDSQEGSDIKLKSLPAGTYLETVTIGPPSDLKQATRALREYAAAEKMEFDVSYQTSAEGGGGERSEKVEKSVWASRNEWYESDPEVVKDVNQWRTRLSFKLK